MVRIGAINRRLPAAVLSVGAALAMCLTACSESADGDNGGTADEGGAGQEGTVRLASGDFGHDSLDPAMEGRSATLDLTLQMWDTLLEIGPDGELAPGVAEEWEVSDDGLTWTFHLRSGIQFHDDWGELTAEDVKFSIERFQNEQSIASASSLLRGMIDSVEVVDDYTLTIHTNNVEVTLPYVLSPHQSEGGIVFPKKYLLDEAGDDFQAQSELLNEHPVGSGPFKFVERSLSDSMVFEAVEEHWRTTPTFERLEIYLAPEPATQLAMLLSGDVDVIAISGDQKQQVEDAGMEVRRVEDALAVGIMIPGTYRAPAADKPTANRDVRRALSYAIDRQGIIDTVLGGEGSLPRTPYVTLPSSSDVDETAFTDWAEEIAEYDPDKARDLLADAGYPDGFSGVDMHTFTRPGTPFLPDLGEIVAAQWAEVGAEVSLVATDYNQYRDHLSMAPIDDAYNAAAPVPFSSGPRYDGIVALESYWLFDNGNVQLLNDPELDRLIEESGGEPDDARRLELTTEALTIANESWVVLEMFNMNALFAVNPEVVGDWQVFPGYATLGRTYETIRRPG